jgi:hypothetical protein
MDQVNRTLQVAVMVRCNVCDEIGGMLPSDAASVDGEFPVWLMMHGEYMRYLK